LEEAIITGMVCPWRDLMRLPLPSTLFLSDSRELSYNIGMKEDEVADVIVAFLVFIGFVICSSIGMVIVTIF
jgi:hypothetical protein